MNVKQQNKHLKQLISVLDQKLEAKDLEIKGHLKYIKWLETINHDELIEHVINNYQCKSMPEETERKEYVPVTVEERR